MFSVNIEFCLNILFCCDVFEIFVNLEIRLPDKVASVWIIIHEIEKYELWLKRRIVIAAVD